MTGRKNPERQHQEGGKRGTECEKIRHTSSTIRRKEKTNKKKNGKVNTRHNGTQAGLVPLMFFKLLNLNFFLHKSRAPVSQKEGGAANVKKSCFSNSSLCLSSRFRHSHWTCWNFANTSKLRKGNTASGEFKSHEINKLLAPPP